jgi:hypothetical protein
LQNGLTVQKGATVKNGLTVEDGATIKKGLTVENALTIAADGTATFKKGLTVENALTTLQNGLTVEKGATVKNGLTVEGDASFKGDVKLGRFSTEDKDELERIVWLRDLGKNWNELLIKYKASRGHFNRGGFGIHMHDEREFGIFTSNVTPLFSVEGKTGNAWLNGGLTVQGGLTVETGAATFRKGLTVEGGATLSSAVRLGDFTKDDKREFDKIVWLKDDNDASWNEQLLKYSSQDGHFKHGGFGIHMHKTREFGIWSSGPVELFSVEGGSGNAWIKGGLTVEGDVTLKNKLSFGKQYGDSLVFFDMGNDGISLAAGVQHNTLYHRSSANFAWYLGGKHSGTELDPGKESDTKSGTRVMSLTAAQVTKTEGTTTVEVAPAGLTVEVDAILKQSLKVEGGARIKQEDWKEVGPPNGVVNFEHSWSTNYQSGVGQLLAFFKDSLGIVHLRGFAINRHDHEGPCIFKLPEGYRPATSATYIVRADGGAGFVYLEIEDDQVRLSGPSGPINLIWLDGVTFRAK